MSARRRALLVALSVVLGACADGDGADAVETTVPTVTRPATDRPAVIEASVDMAILGETIQIGGTCGIDPDDGRLDDDPSVFTATVIGAKVTELDGTEPLFEDQFVEVVTLDFTTDGEFDQPITIPADVEPGGYELRLNCIDPTTTLDRATTLVRVEPA